MNDENKRTTVTINRYMAGMLKKATVEATKRSKSVIKQSELINYLIEHRLNDAIEAIVEKKTR